MENNFQFKGLNPYHSEVFKSTDFILLVYGGTSAGKTYTVADKLILRSMLEKEIKFLVIRKTLPSLRNTCMEIIAKRCEEHLVPYHLNKATNIADIGNDCKIYFLSVNSSEDVEKVKSITDVSMIWVEEATEIRLNDFLIIKNRLRGGKGGYKQLILTFNPVGRTSWIYKYFWDLGYEKCKKLRYTILDNPFVWEGNERYIESLKATKDTDPYYYRVYFEGEWGDLEGVIFQWDVVELPDMQFDEVFYGGDFGYSVDPAVVVRIYRRADEFWVEEIIYQTGLTNQELGRKMEEAGIDKDDPVYFDSAEPKSIEELCQMGFNVLPSEKGADSVRSGIDLLRSKKIHIVEGSSNVIKEQRSYTWQKDKDGNSTNKPKTFDNHSMDAIRYGIGTHCRVGELQVFV